MKRFVIKSLILSICLFFVVSLSFAAGTWVAKVDGKTISDTELHSIVNQIQILTEIGSGRSMGDQFKNKKMQKQVLVQQIMQQLLVNEIKQINTTKKFIDPAIIQQEKTQIANVIEKALWIREYTNRVLRPQVSVSQQAIDNIYNQNKTKDPIKNVPVAEAKAYFKEELALQQMQPFLAQLQNKAKTDSNITINDKYFQ